MRIRCLGMCHIFYWGYLIPLEFHFLSSLYILDMRPYPINSVRTAGSQAEDECSLHSVPAVQICFRTALFSKHGVWGFAPCSPTALDHFPLPYLCLPHELSFRAILFIFPQWGMGLCPMFTNGP